MYEDTIVIKCFQVMNSARREDIGIICCQEDGAQVLDYSDEEWEIIVDESFSTALDEMK